MKTGKVICRNMQYDLYHPNGEFLATTNSMAGIIHCLRRYGLTGYILLP